MKKALRTVLVVLLTLVLMLPLCLSAFAEEGDPVQGYSFDYDPNLSKNGGYISAWKGSSIVSAPTYANWILSDGSFQGMFQWGNVKATNTTIFLDSETGVIRCQGIYDAAIQINPVENAKIPAITAENPAPVYFSFETYAEAETFSGMSFGIFENKTDLTLFCVGTDETNMGKVYWGNSTALESAYSGASFTMGVWNRVEMFIMPVFDGTSMASCEVYFRVRPVDQCVKSWGITQDELDTMAHTTWGTKTLFTTSGGGKPYFKSNREAAAGNYFDLRDFRIFRMSENQDLYKVSFEGYPDLNAYVPVNRNEVTGKIIVPSAEGVEFWAYGTDTDADYPVPGEEMTVVVSRHYEVAADDVKMVASLVGAYNAIHTDEIGVYSYAELKAGIVRIQDALDEAVAGGVVSTEEGGENYIHYVTANERMDTIQAEMDKMATNARQLINAWKIFSDTEQPLADRISAYESVKNKAADPTYSDDCRAALEYRNVFKVMLDAIQEDWDAYNEKLPELEAASGSAAARLVTEVLGYIINIRYNCTEFEYDAIFDEKYTSYLTSQKNAIVAAEGADAKYTLLVEMVTLYNKYHYALNRSNKTVPADVQAAIDDYNQAVLNHNLELLGAVNIAASTSTTLIGNEYFGKMVATLTAIMAPSDATGKDGDN
ncbi:MAG: hypothetical protein ACI3XE_03825 [Eubacteriales bacterium]